VGKTLGLIVGGSVFTGIITLIIIFSPRTLIYPALRPPRDYEVYIPKINAKTSGNEIHFSLLFSLRNTPNYTQVEMVMTNIYQFERPRLSFAVQLFNGSWVQTFLLKGDKIFNFQKYLISCPNLCDKYPNATLRCVYPDAPLRFFFKCPNAQLLYACINGIGKLPDIIIDPVTSQTLYIYLHYPFEDSFPSITQ